MSPPLVREGSPPPPSPSVVAAVEASAAAAGSFLPALVPPVLSRLSSAVSSSSSSVLGEVYQHAGDEGPHRRSPSLPASAMFAGQSPALQHPVKGGGGGGEQPTVSAPTVRPSALQLDTSNLWWTAAGDDQHSRGRSTEVEISPSRSATSSPISRFHSPITAKTADHQLGGFQAQAAPSAVGNVHHTPSNLRHSRIPSLGSPDASSTSFPVVGRPTPPHRPGMVSHHSHLVPSSNLPWQQRLRLACTSPDTARWQVPACLAPYVPFMAWAGTSLAFLVVFTFWRQELFDGLDTMSISLSGMGLLGKVIMGLLIFLTCFPPLPLYSTLIILSGYAFGAWDGFVISYIAAMSGAVVVFLLSRSLFRGAMIRMLSKSPSLARVIHAIESRPSLLFLIRLAPYPYNLMNSLLASSRTLSLKVYSGVTGVSLFKLIVHTTIGSTIHNWGEHYASPGGDGVDAPQASGGKGSSPGLTQEQIDAAAKGQMIQKTWSVIGIGLCIGLFIYLTIVARNAVNETTSPAGAYAALPTAVDGAREMGERGLSLDRSSESPDARRVGGVGSDQAGGEQWRNGRQMSVAGLHEIVGLSPPPPSLP